MARRRVALRSLAFWAALSTLFVWTACTAGRLPVEYSEYRETENFDNYRYFAVLEAGSESQQRTQPEEHELHQLIQRALLEELGRQGYTLASRESPDFLVAFHCRTREELHTSFVDQAWYFEGDDVIAKPITPRRVVSTIRRGSVVVDFLSPDRRRTWRGVARGSISPDATRDDLERIVARSIREILAEFPPPP